MNIKFSTNDNELNNEVNNKLIEIYQQIGVVSVYLIQIKEINNEIKISN